MVQRLPNQLITRSDPIWEHRVIDWCTERRQFGEKREIQFKCWLTLDGQATNSEQTRNSFYALLSKLREWVQHVAGWPERLANCCTIRRVDLSFAKALLASKQKFRQSKSNMFALTKQQTLVLCSDREAQRDFSFSCSTRINHENDRGTKKKSSESGEHISWSENA